MIDSKLLAILVCPVTKAELAYHRETKELWCAESGLAYPIRDDIPVLLREEARQLTAAERESMRPR